MRKRLLLAPFGDSASAGLLLVFVTLLPLHTVTAQDAKPSVARGLNPIVETTRTGIVDFEKEVLPVLKNNCLACHNQTKAKADLILETPQAILKGGESGPAVMPGKSSESLLLKLASHQEKPNMPPKDNKVNASDLTPQQLALIKLWIDQGAQGEVHAAVPVEWRSLPAGVNPIYAVAVTSDGQFAACGRANQIFIYHIPSGQLVTRLSDPQLDSEVQSSRSQALGVETLDPKTTGVAHRDLVHSLAFSPDGDLLASGGYREVKLWRRPRNVHEQLSMDGWQPPNDTGAGPALAESRTQDRKSATPQAIAVSADGKWLATCRSDGAIRLWDTASGKEARSFGARPSGGAATSEARSTSEAAQTERGGSVGVRQQHKPVVCLNFSPNGDRLCSAAADNTLRIWAVPEGTLLAQSNLNAGIGALTWLSGGSGLATSGADDLIRIWQIREGTNSMLILMSELKGRGGVITCLESLAAGPQANWTIDGFELWSDPLAGDWPQLPTPLLPQPTFLLSGSASGIVCLWNFKTGRIVREMDQGASVTAVGFSFQGGRVAAAALNNSVKLWNAEDGTLLAQMKGDRYAQEFVAETERSASVAATEITYRKNALVEAEKQQKSATERLGKANEGFAAADKTFSEKQKQLQAALESRTAAEKGLAALNSVLKKVTEDYESADKSARQAAAEAKATLERATNAKLLADQATQTKIETERIAADAAAVASRSKTAAGGNLADPTKAAAEKMAAGAADVAEKAKAFAESAAGDAAAKAAAASEAKIAAEKAIDEVAAKSFAVGQMKPRFDTVTSEYPEKSKQAAEKLAAATNALAGVDKEFKKAEQPKSTAEQELELAKTAVQQATDSATQARGALLSAEAGQQTAEAAVHSAKKIALESERPVRALAFSPDGRVLATAGDDRNIHTWSGETGAAFETFKPGSSTHAGLPGDDPSLLRDSNLFLALAFTSPDRLLSASPAEGLTSWSLNAAWKLERIIGTGGPGSPLTDRVNALRFSPDGRWLATGGGEPSRGGEIILWKTADGTMEKEFMNAHSDTVLALDFSPDGKSLASGAADKFVKVIELASGKVIKSFEGHLHHVLGVSWKRDGRTLASSGADNVVKVWDFASGERKKNIEGFNKEVTSVAFIDATDQALASSGDNQVRLVRENGESVRTFSGATDYVYSAMATPDGKIVIAGGQDSMLRVWNGLNGKPITNFPPP